MGWLLLADGKEFIRGKWNIKCLFLLLFVVLAGISFHAIGLADKKTQNLEKIKVGIANYDGSEYSKLLLSFFDNNEAVQTYVEIQYGTKEELEMLLMQNKLQVVLVVPENFVQNMMDIENTPLHILLNIEDTTKAIVMKNLLEGYEKFVSAVEVNCVTLYEVMKQDGLPKELIDKKNVEISLRLITTVVNKNELFSHLEIDHRKQIPMTVFYCNVITLLFTMYLAAGCGSKILQQQRTGIVDRLLTTGVPLALFYLEKGILFTVLSFLPGLLCYLIAALSSKGTLPIEGFLLWMITALLFSTFSFLLSAFFQRKQDYWLTVHFIVFFLAVLGGGIIPFMYLPESMVKIAEKTPLYQIVMQMNSLLIKEVPENFANIMKLFLGTAFLFFLVGYGLQKKKGGKRYEEL